MGRNSGVGSQETRDLRKSACYEYQGLVAVSVVGRIGTEEVRGVVVLRERK